RASGVPLPGAARDRGPPRRRLPRGFRGRSDSGAARLRLRESAGGGARPDRGGNPDGPARRGLEAAPRVRGRGTCFSAVARLRERSRPAGRGARRSPQLRSDAGRAQREAAAHRLSLGLGHARSFPRRLRRRRAAADVRSRRISGASPARRGGGARAGRHAARLRARLRADPPRPRDSRRGAAVGGREGDRGTRGRRVTGYRVLAETLEAVTNARGKLAKIDRLAETLRRIEGDELAVAARLLSGSPFAEYEQAV